MERKRYRLRYSQLYPKIHEMPWTDKPTDAELDEWHHLRTRLTADDIVFFEVGLFVLISGHMLEDCCCRPLPSGSRKGSK